MRCWRALSHTFRPAIATTCGCLHAVAYAALDIAVVRFPVVPAPRRTRLPHGAHRTQVRSRYVVSVHSSPLSTLDDYLARLVHLNAIARERRTDDRSLWGARDLMAGILPTSARPRQDPVRILRAARFLARFRCDRLPVADETIALSSRVDACESIIWCRARCRSCSARCAVPRAFLGRARWAHWPRCCRGRRRLWRSAARRIHPDRAGVPNRMVCDMRRARAGDDWWASLLAPTTWQGLTPAHAFRATSRTSTGLRQLAQLF